MTLICRMSNDNKRLRNVAYLYPCNENSKLHLRDMELVTGRRCSHTIYRINDNLEIIRYENKPIAGDWKGGIKTLGYGKLTFLHNTKCSVMRILSILGLAGSNIFNLVTVLPRVRSLWDLDTFSSPSPVSALCGRRLSLLLHRSHACSSQLHRLGVKITKISLNAAVFF